MRVMNWLENPPFPGSGGMFQGGELRPSPKGREALSRARGGRKGGLGERKKTELTGVFFLF